MNFRKTTIIILGAAVIGWGVFYTVEYFSERTDEGMIFDQLPVQTPFVEETHVITEEEPAVPAIPQAEPAQPKIWSNIPFVSQAPTGEWGRSEFQNGCEEASVLMVHAWRTGKAYTKDQAKQELIDMARYQEEQIGQGIDTDTADTARVLLDRYFSIADYRIDYDFTLEELKQSLAEGLSIVPTNGQALKNPNFTRLGPLQHMLVVTGYDVMTKEFITNDPGTRKGEGYRYPEQILFDAIREYPTGKHLPIQTERKAMIVIPAITIP
ncbi:MAG: C39 family peptidase [Candidatus Moraniibacteriota bacterium]